MRFNYIGKLLALFIALFLNLPIPGIAIVFAIGYIIDMRWNYIKYFFTKKFKTQESSENFIFICAYFCYCLNLDTKKAVKIFIKEISSANNDTVESLFIYYKDIYIPKKNKKPEVLNVQVTKTFEDFGKTMAVGDNTLLFGLLEEIFNDQKPYASQVEMEFLVKFASFLKINYIRKENNKQSSYTTYSYKEKDYKEKEQPNAKQGNYKSKDEEYKSSYISQDVKDAFNFLGFDAKCPPVLSDLKREYKVLVRKYHPDILKGQNASVKKIEEAEKKLTKLNKSMDLAKNFLAKG